MPEPVSDLELAASTAASAVSRNVRTRRIERHWTIDQLAARSNVSKGMIIQVEQGKTNPSITTLARLANALGVNMATLVETNKAAPSVVVVRADEGKVLWTARPGTMGTLLVSSHGPDNAELWNNVLAAGDGLQADPHPPGTRELILVIVGKLTVEVAGVPHDLDMGDAITFRGDQPHAYLNHGSEDARYALTVVWPGSITEEELHGH